MRRKVLPILYLVVWAIIAGALVKLAFFGNQAADKAREPWADFTPTTVVATVGDISTNLELQGTVITDPAVDVKATAAGKIAKFEVEDGAQVEVGAPILTLVHQVTEDPVEEVDREGNKVTKPGASYEEYRTIYANANGKITFSVLKGQDLAIGNSVGSIAPGSLSVQANLTPAQRYRMTAVPEVATVTVKPGPAPFECRNLKIANATPGTAPAPKPAVPEAPDAPGPGGPGGESGNSGQASATISCPIPGDITVYPGMSATLAMHQGDATGVLLVPTTAVKGDYETGSVWKINPGTEPQETVIELGLTDGAKVEVKSGLRAGDEILEFIPGKEKEIDPLAELEQGELLEEGGGTPGESPADTQPEGN